MAVLIRPAPFGRRLGAAFYDSLLLLALWAVAAFVAIALKGGEPPAAGSTEFQGVLLGLAMLFNAWFWTHGGQTLGMRAWRLQVRKEGGGTVSWGRAGLRFLFAVPAWGLAGLGIFWALAHPENKTWQDLLSGTETILLPAPSADQTIPE
jgi:uncharacterized RDD family membrane protein YckC